MLVQTNAVNRVPIKWKALAPYGVVGVVAPKVQSFHISLASTVSEAGVPQQRATSQTCPSPNAERLLSSNLIKQPASAEIKQPASAAKDSTQRQTRDASPDPTPTVTISRQQQLSAFKMRTEAKPKHTGAAKDERAADARPVIASTSSLTSMTAAKLVLTPSAPAAMPIPAPCTNFAFAATPQLSLPVHLSSDGSGKAAFKGGMRDLKPHAATGPGAVSQVSAASVAIASATNSAHSGPDSTATPLETGREHSAATSSQATQAGSLVPIAQIFSGTRLSGLHFNNAAPTPQTTLAAQPEQPGAARTLTATPNSLEVGLSDGAHGWLRVHAELNPFGVVNAAVVASSASSAESLSRHLPEMNAYLAQESTHIGAIVVHASSQNGASANSSNELSSSSATGPFAGGQSDRGSGGQEEKSDPHTQSFLRGPSAGDEASERLRGSWGDWPSRAVMLQPWQSAGATHWVSVRV